jgi:membrane protein YdbS with pleckstrin-like domain
MMNERKILRVSALVYTGISLCVAILFFVAASALGYSVMARVGGTVWVFLLSMIVSMPIVTSYWKKRHQGDAVA